MPESPRDHVAQVSKGLFNRRHFLPAIYTVGEYVVGEPFQTSRVRAALSENFGVKTESAFAELSHLCELELIVPTNAESIAVYTRTDCELWVHLMGIAGRVIGP